MASTTWATNDPISLKGTFLLLTGSSIDELAELFEEGKEIEELFEDELDEKVEDETEFNETEFEMELEDGNTVPQLIISIVNKGANIILFIKSLIKINNNK